MGRAGRSAAFPGGEPRCGGLRGHFRRRPSRRSTSSQLKRYQRQLESLASTDPLTGLLNRRFFRISAEDEMHRQKRRAGGMAAVVLFDLDQFKRVNDRRWPPGRGRHAEDGSPRSPIPSCAGPFDKLGRWGRGGVRGCCCRSVNRDQAWLVCDRLRERLEHAEIEYDGKIPVGDRQLRLRDADGRTAARSTACWKQRTARSSVSKTTGRNRVTYAGPRLAATA